MAPFKTLWYPILELDDAYTNLNVSDIGRSLTLRGGLYKGASVFKLGSVNTIPMGRLVKSFFTSGLAMSYWLNAYYQNFTNNADYKLLSCDATGGTFDFFYNHGNGLTTSSIYVKDPSGTVIGSAVLPVAVAASTWYGVKVRISSTDIYFEFNGTSFTCAHAIAWTNPAGQYLRFYMMGDGSNSQGYFDDFCVNDLAGAVDNNVPPFAKFFTATRLASDGVNSGFSCVPAGPTPQAALVDGLDTNEVRAFGHGNACGEILPDSTALYVNADRVLCVGFYNKGLVKQTIQSPDFSNRLSDGVNNYDTPLTVGLTPGNEYAAFFYKTGTTEFSKAEFDSFQGQIVTQ